MHRFGSMNGDVPPLADYWHKKLSEGNGSLAAHEREEALRIIQAAEQQQATALINESQEQERRRLLSPLEGR